jgi:transcriptional regulator with XRE-family HTH domain
MGVEVYKKYNPIAVGYKFAQIRDKCGWKQNKLATELGYSSNAHLSDFENGKGMLPFDKLLKAAHIFKMPVEVLIGILIDERDYDEKDIELIDSFIKKVIHDKDFEYSKIFRKLLKD